MVEAETKIQAVAIAIENQSAEAMSIARVLELAASFSFKKENFKLVAPHRRFIAESDCLLDHALTVKVSFLSRLFPISPRFLFILHA